MKRFAPFLLSLPACVITSPGVQVFGACATTDALPIDRLQSGAYATSLDGVRAVGAGEVPDDCRQDGVLASAEEATDLDGWWLQGPDPDGHPWTLGVWLPQVPAPPAGAIGHVAFTYDGTDDAPPVGTLEIRDRRDRLIAWLGFAADVRDLRPPGDVELTRGEQAWTTWETCGRWATYDVDVTSRDVTGVLPYGDRLTLDGLELRHGGFEKMRAEDPRCEGHLAPFVAVAIVPDSD